MKKIKCIGIFLMVFLGVISNARGESLTVLYYDRPPYYETVDGRAKGLLIEMTRTIFEDAGVDHVFETMPPSRILLYLKNSDQNICSVGWFKNSEREKFANFSLPIYQNMPMVILTARHQSHLIEMHKTLKDVLSDRSLTIALIDSFSYGEYIDGLIRQLSPVTHTISSQQNLLPAIILNYRASFMLIAPEEIGTLLTSSGLHPKDFVSISKPDIPTGNKRYLMFSKNVPLATIERINRSIQKLSLLDLSSEGDN